MAKRKGSTKAAKATKKPKVREAELGVLDPLWFVFTKQTNGRSFAYQKLRTVSGEETSDNSDLPLMNLKIC
jgi:hypothetical protein